MDMIGLFRYTNNLIGNYYGDDSELSDEDIKKRFISARGWIMFPDRNISSIKEGKSADIPNIYLWTDQDPVLWENSGEEMQFGADAKFHPELNFGITFNNLKSVDRLLSIVDPANAIQRKEFERLIHKVSSESYLYHINVKTNFKHPNRPPVFDRLYSNRSDALDLVFVCNEIKTKRLLVSKDEGAVESRGKVIRRTLSFDPITCNTKTWDDFGHHFTIVFNAFLQILNVQTGKDLKNANKKIELDIEKVRVIDRILKFNKTLTDKRRNNLESLREIIVNELKAKGISN